MWTSGLWSSVEQKRGPYITASKEYDGVKNQNVTETSRMFHLSELKIVQN